MNTQPSPLVPQGQLLDPKNKGRARVKIAVFFVLAVHGIGLMALLMQGCRREEPVQPVIPETDTNTAVAPMLDDTNALPVDTNTNVYVPPVVDTNIATGTTPATPVDAIPAIPAAPATEYKVAKGDSFYTIAKKFNVTSKAIADANPNVNPAKLQIGQTLSIPAAGQPGPAVTAPVNAGAAEGQVYTVKSGDTLTRIASRHGVTIKAIRSANNLSTDRITVGQKLKIPAKSAAQ